jgi:hypothetical protein
VSAATPNTAAFADTIRSQADASVFREQLIPVDGANFGAKKTMPSRLRKKAIISSRRPSGARSERALARFPGKSAKWSLGYVGPKEKNNPHQGRGAKGRNAIDRISGRNIQKRAK